MRKQGNIAGRDRFLSHVANRLGRQPMLSQPGTFAGGRQAPQCAFKGVPEHYAGLQLDEQEKVQLFIQNWTALNGKAWVVKQEAAAEGVKSILQEVLQEQGVTKVSRWHHDDLNALEVDGWIIEQGIEVVPWTDGQESAADVADASSDEVVVADSTVTLTEQHGTGMASAAVHPAAERSVGPSNWSARSPLLQQTEKCGLGLVWPDYVIANTGTLALFAYEGRGRSVSLLPDRLFAVFRANQLVTRMGEVFSALKEKYPDAADLPSSVNLVTGPSRSADIENDLTIGVHGPGQVYAVIIE